MDKGDIAFFIIIHSAYVAVTLLRVLFLIGIPTLANFVFYGDLAIPQWSLNLQSGQYWCH